MHPAVVAITGRRSCLWRPLLGIVHKNKLPQVVRALVQSSDGFFRRHCTTPQQVDDERRTPRDTFGGCLLLPVLRPKMTPYCVGSSSAQAEPQKRITHGTPHSATPGFLEHRLAADFIVRSDSVAARTCCCPQAGPSKAKPAGKTAVGSASNGSIQRFEKGIGQQRFARRRDKHIQNVCKHAATFAMPAANARGERRTLTDTHAREASRDPRPCWDPMYCSHLRF